MAPQGAVDWRRLATERSYAQGYAALAAGDSSLASRFFFAQIAFKHTDERAWIGLGAALEQAEQPLKAAACYRMGLRFIPSSAWLGFALGRVLKALDRPKEADEVLCRAEDWAQDEVLKCIREEMSSDA
ncbi:MAG: hypothetical protein R3B89_05685 [Polyangiaceae bacterium]